MSAREVAERVVNGHLVLWERTLMIDAGEVGGP
jgi:hypothetical protein